MAESSPPNGPTGGNGGVTRRDCPCVQVVICVTENVCQDYLNDLFYSADLISSEVTC